MLYGYGIHILFVCVQVYRKFWPLTFATAIINRFFAFLDVCPNDPSQIQHTMFSLPAPIFHYFIAA